MEEASRTDIRLAELENPSLKKILHKYTGRVPIYAHPCFYRALKLRYPMDIGGISRDGRVTNELGSGSLRQVFGILTPSSTLSQVSGSDGVEYEGTGGFKQV